MFSTYLKRTLTSCNYMQLSRIPRIGNNFGKILCTFYETKTHRSRSNFHYMRTIHDCSDQPLLLCSISVLLLFSDMSSLQAMRAFFTNLRNFLILAPPA